MTTIDWGALEAAAKAVRARAYAPYSRYRVGAAVLDEQGRVHAGCNVENASYGLTICAERGAVMKLVSEGGARVVAAVVVTGGDEAGSPCGACRQVLAEIAGDAPVRAISVDDAGRETDRFDSSVDALLPRAFRGALVTGA